MYATKPFYGYVNKTILTICDCLGIQRIPAFSINVVQGNFRGSFYREVCPVYSPKTLWETMFFKKKKRTGFVNFFLSPWKFNVFVNKAICNHFCHSSNDHRYCILSNSKCICGFSKLSLVRKIIHFNSNLQLHRSRFLKSCRNLVFLLMYWQSFLHKTRNDRFDIRKFSFHSSAITLSFRN